MQFDIVIPVLNEEITLIENINSVVSFLANELPAENEYFVCIADNGSKDKTYELATDLAEKFANVRVIRTDRPGVGLALQNAWATSRADVVGYMDLDLATDIRHLVEIVQHFCAEPDLDMVYGSRLHKESNVQGRSLKREIVSRVFNFILRNYLSVSLSDGMCGFKFLKRSRVAELQKFGAESEGWFFCSEIVVLALKLKMKVRELPVRWVDDPDSKVKIKKLTVEYLKAMRNLKLRFGQLQ